MSNPDEHRSSSISSSSSSEHHHHHHHHHSSKKKKHMDDSDRFKRRGLSSIKRRQILGKITYWVLVLIALGIILAMIYTYHYTSPKHYVG